MRRSDFAGLRHLREKLGERFRCGVVVYTGESTVPLGDRLFAVPLSGLYAPEGAAEGAAAAKMQGDGPLR